MYIFQKYKLNQSGETCLFIISFLPPENSLPPAANVFYLSVVLYKCPPHLSRVVFWKNVPSPCVWALAASGLHCSTDLERGMSLAPGCDCLSELNCLLEELWRGWHLPPAKLYFSKMQINLVHRMRWQISLILLQTRKSGSIISSRKVNYWRLSRCEEYPPSWLLEGCCQVFLELLLLPLQPCLLGLQGQAEGCSWFWWTVSCGQSFWGI